MPRPGGYYSGAVGGALPGASMGLYSVLAADLACPAGVSTSSAIVSNAQFNEDGTYMVGMAAVLVIQLGAVAPTQVQLQIDTGAAITGLFTFLNVPASLLVANALITLSPLLLVGNGGTPIGTFPFRLHIQPLAQAVTLKAGSAAAALVLRSQD